MWRHFGCLDAVLLHKCPRGRRVWKPTNWADVICGQWTGHWTVPKQKATFVLLDHASLKFVKSIFSNSINLSQLFFRQRWIKIKLFCLEERQDPECFTQLIVVHAKQNKDIYCKRSFFGWTSFALLLQCESIDIRADLISKSNFSFGHCLNS